MTSEKYAVITGAYGFLGRHVAKEYSDAGWTVTGLGHGSWSQNEWQKWGITEWHTCDISMESLQTYITEADTVVHCAGSGSVSFSMNHPYQDFQRTVQTTITILEFIRLNFPKAHILYPSSAAVYGTVERLPISESDPLNPISPYGRNKRIGEEICQLYACHFNIPVSIVRFFSLYGTTLRKQILWDACMKISRGDYQFYGTGNEIRDLLHIKDAVHLIRSADRVASPEAPIINGGTGVTVTIRDLLNEIARNLGAPGSPSFTSGIRPGDPIGYLADIRVAESTGWSPSVQWKDGVMEYVRWFLGEIE